MAWPPAALPTNRSNSTPQQDTHAADHNAEAATINEIVSFIGYQFPRHLKWVRGGYTTNAYGGIVISDLGFNIWGAVAIQEALGYACIKSDATPPPGTAWIDVFSTPNGAAAPNTFIILDAIIWG
jgi:hypothetical protein